MAVQAAVSEYRGAQPEMSSKIGLGALALSLWGMHRVLGAQCL